MTTNGSQISGSAKVKLFQGALGIITIFVGLIGIIYDGEFVGAGIVTAGLAITSHALS